MYFDTGCVFAQFFDNLFFFVVFADCCGHDQAHFLVVAQQGFQVRVGVSHQFELRQVGFGGVGVQAVDEVGVAAREIIEASTGENCFVVGENLELEFYERGEVAQDAVGVVRVELE